MLEVVVSANACSSNASARTTAMMRSSETGRFWQKGSEKRRREDSDSSTGSESILSRSLATLESSTSAVARKKKVIFQKRKKNTEEVQSLVDDQIGKAHAHWTALGHALPPTEEVDSQTAHSLTTRIMGDLDIISTVATKSGNLKGTFVRALKESVASIKMAAEILSKRSSSEETEKLQRDNSRLQAEVAELRKEMTELRREMVAARAQWDQPSPPAQQPAPERMEVPEPLPSGNGGEEIFRNIMVQVGTMVNARLEALEGRLLPEKRLRPPLAADKNKRDGPAVTSQLKKGREATKQTASENQQPRSAAPKPPSQVNDEGWTEVGRGRGKKKKTSKKEASEKTAAAAAARAGPKPAKKTGPSRLRPPRSSAVVITLQLQAEENGVTYAKVLAEAKEKITLVDCGITGLRFRRAATGARILEVPGASSGEQADTLAQKLREFIGEVAKVSRPTKCAELRITGLCDSVTPVEIIAAVAEQGGCPRECVRVGPIRCDSWGHSSIWVSCPVAAANKLGTRGRLLVGWVSAQTILLKPRPMRCYKCLQSGHVSAVCTSEVDRSNDCYRCGVTGHKAASCKAIAPNCALCAGKKPADHVLGSKKCSPPKPTKRVQKTAESGPSTQKEGEESMTVN